MSKHFHYNSVMPLSEANLSKHTLQSPPSREAKLKHILVYVDLQRELIALEEQVYSETEKNNNVNNMNNMSDRRTTPSPSSPDANTFATVRSSPLSPTLSLTKDKEKEKEQRSEMASILALPRALPRSMSNQDRPLYRNMFLSDQDTSPPSSPPPQLRSRHAVSPSPINITFEPSTPFKHEIIPGARRTESPVAQSPSPSTPSEKKGRFSRFSFLGRSTSRAQNHKRHESVPATKTDPWCNAKERERAKFSSLTYRSGSRLAGSGSGMEVTGPMEDSRYDHPQQQQRQPQQEQTTPKSKVKRLFQDIFKSSTSSSSKSKKISEHTAREISLPSTYLGQQPESALEGSRQAQCYYNPRHSLVRSKQQHLQSSLYYYPDHQQQHYQNMEQLQQQQQRQKEERRGLLHHHNEDDDDSYMRAYAPLAQASLTPPPASSVLRHSTSSNRIFGLVSDDFDQVNGGGGGGGACRSRPRTRPSSQLIAPVQRADLEGLLRQSPIVVV
ncbi:hypothetical protein CPC16_001054 [Podila verticillata]|nr:hypothetical protein CPC16_001054 [Podila verticillata]